MPDSPINEVRPAGTARRVSLSAPTERVAKAAARVLLAANKKRGVPSDAKTEWLARS